MLEIAWKTVSICCVQSTFLVRMGQSKLQFHLMHESPKELMVVYQAIKQVVRKPSLKTVEAMLVTTKGVVLEVPSPPQDLQKGTKILAADGTLVEVIKLEVQKTNKLLELERLGTVEENIRPEVV